MQITWQPTRTLGCRAQHQGLPSRGRFVSRARPRGAMDQAMVNHHCKHGTEKRHRYLKCPKASPFQKTDPQLLTITQTYGFPGLLLVSEICGRHCLPSALLADEYLRTLVVSNVLISRLSSALSHSPFAPFAETSPLPIMNQCLSPNGQAWYRGYRSGKAGTAINNGPHRSIGTDANSLLASSTASLCASYAAITVKSRPHKALILGFVFFCSALRGW